MKKLEKENIFSNLLIYCCWNSPEEVKKIFKNTSEYFDVTYKDGKLFHIAIAHGFIDVLNILLEYYEENKLKIKPDQFQGSGYNEKYATYLDAKNKLHEILEEAYDSVPRLLPEIEKILNKYGVPTSNPDSDTEETSLENINYVVLETPETSESNEISSSLEDSSLLGEGH